jgi:hypothetical protein
MAETHKIEGFVLRYAPQANRTCSVEIGLVVANPAGPDAFAAVRFKKNWRDVLCVDPEADIELFEAMEREIGKILAQTEDRDKFLKRAREGFSGAIQIEPIAVMSARSPAEEFETLAEMYLKAPPKGRERVSTSGRMRVWKKMNSEFERAGILELMLRDIPMAQYTGEGDPLKIDFAYRVKDTLKMFHALSLKASVDQATLLALKYPVIERGLKEQQGIESRLTAVLEDGLERERADVGYALATLEMNRVRVAYIGEIAAIAEEAKADLET